MAQWSQLATFAYLERLLPNTEEFRLPVIVLDIRHVEVTGKADRPVTSRMQLQGIIQALADAKAAAIGVDLDFSSDDETGYRDPVADPKFFDFCSKLAIPVFLGVYRTRHGAPEEWLAADKYKQLAASIEAASNRTENKRAESAASTATVSDSEDEEDDSRTLARIPSDFATAGKARLNSLSSALAEAYFTKSTVHAERPKAPVPKFLLAEDTPVLGNFSKVGQLRRERSLAWTPAAIAATSEDFAGHIVLLGNVEDNDKVENDFFRPPLGRKQPGVLYHGSAVYTFIREPLYEFRWWVRIVLDVVGTLPFFLAIWVKRRWAPSRQHHEIRRRWIDRAALLAALLLLPVLGGICLLRFRIMWLEALIAGVALVLHMFLGPYVESLWKIAAAWWRKRRRSATGAAT